LIGNEGVGVGLLQGNAPIAGDELQAIGMRGDLEPAAVRMDIGSCKALCQIDFFDSSKGGSGGTGACVDAERKT